jgi:hypothetical protein
LAAYLYLPRACGAKVARTTDEGDGMRVDFDGSGRPMGVEITAPSAVGIERINAVLKRLGQPELPAEEWAPASAA